MSDPYRSSAGQPCPRCKNPLARESDDEWNCGSGCGTWLGNRLLASLIDPATLRNSKGNPFRATALPRTACLICRQPLNAHYKGTVDVLVLGQCLPHGVWLEQADRATFEALYADEIRAHALTTAKQALLDSLDPHLAALTVRVEKLEAIVRTQQQALDAQQLEIDALHTRS